MIDDPDVEAVVIVTPTTTHRDLVRATLAAGKPLLCEKPLATTLRRRARDVRRGRALGGVTAQVGFHSRFHPLINELARLVRSDELGAPMGYTLRDDQYWPTGDVVPGHSSWRSQRAHAGGGALLEHSIHSADILSWLFGPARARLRATRNVFGYDVEDTAVCTIEHASGVVGTLISIFNGVRGREERRLEVFFERGAVEVTTDFLVGAPEDSFLIQRPDQRRRSASTSRMLPRRTSPRWASTGATSSSTSYPADRGVGRRGTRPDRAAAPRLRRRARRPRARRRRVPLGRERRPGRGHGRSRPAWDVAPARPPPALPRRITSDPPW